jgi:hypothetical protein
MKKENAEYYPLWAKTLKFLKFLFVFFYKLEISSLGRYLLRKQT